jgi:hypothetical protein
VRLPIASEACCVGWLKLDVEPVRRCVPSFELRHRLIAREEPVPFSWDRRTEQPRRLSIGKSRELSYLSLTMWNMKRIGLEIEVEEDSNLVTWRLDDWRGTVSSGVSVDATNNLVHLWAGDIEHVMDEVRGELEMSGLGEQ